MIPAVLFTCMAFSISIFADSTKTDSSPSANPRVKMDTSKGTVIIELFPEQAPVTVKNFLHYVEEGKYTDTLFHRVIANLMNQGGAYNHRHQKIATFPAIRNEADNGLKNKRGTIAMVRTDGPHSATNQFFINTADNAALDFKDRSEAGWGYCVFGEVTEGMDIMDRIAKVRTKAHGPFDNYAPVYPVSIRSISTIE